MRRSTATALSLTVAASIGFGCAPSSDSISSPLTGTTTASPPTSSVSTAVPSATSPGVTVGHTTAAAPDSTPALDDPGDLYTLTLASRQISRLTTDPRLDGAPAGTPDGTRLLFARLTSGTDPTHGNVDIYVMNADGTAEQRLTDHPAADVTPRSSPDGNSVVFTSERDGNPEIYLLSLATGEVRRVTDDPAADRFPAFAPDGQTIIFTSDRAGGDDLYAIGVADSGIRRLTDTPGTDWLGEYSPDGATIAFATERSIDLIDADGTHRRTLTADAANHPSWSPDGQRIAAGTRTASGDLAICAIDVATGSITVYTEDEADDFYPAWSPDGVTITFARAPRDR